MLDEVGEKFPAEDVRVRVVDGTVEEEEEVPLLAEEDGILDTEVCSSSSEEVVLRVTDREDREEAGGVVRLVDEVAVEVSFSVFEVGSSRVLDRDEVGSSLSSSSVVVVLWLSLVVSAGVELEVLDDEERVNDLVRVYRGVEDEVSSSSS